MKLWFGWLVVCLVVVREGCLLGRVLCQGGFRRRGGGRGGGLLLLLGGRPFCGFEDGNMVARGVLGVLGGG